jgi:hypothetical protein
VEQITKELRDAGLACSGEAKKDSGADHGKASK